MHDLAPPIRLRAGLWLLSVLLILVLFSAACTGQAAERAPTLEPQAARGRLVFQKHCERCHAASGEGVVVGPSLAGIATRGATRIEGMDAESYIRDSILNPRSFTVEGFPDNLMPEELEGQIEDADLDDLVGYLLSLR